MRKPSSFILGLFIALVGFVPTLAHSANGDLPSAAVAPAAAKRNWSQVHSLKIMSYNVENLFWSVSRTPQETTDGNDNMYLAADKGKGPQVKPEQKTEEIRKIIAEENPDFVVLEEVESLFAVQHLATNSLQGRYSAYLIQGNDERGINIGYLVRTDLPIFVEELTNRDVTYRDPLSGQTIKLFSRDVPVLVVRTTQAGAPVALILGNHAKSKRNRENDPESNHLRTAQYEGMASLVHHYQQIYGSNAPILLAGDYNTDVRTAVEIEPIRGLLKSAFDVAPDTVPVDERITHSFHGDGGTKYSQMDDIRVTSALEPRVLSARIIPYRDSAGRPRPLPRTFAERDLQPSDHRAIVVEIGL